MQAPAPDRLASFIARFRAKVRLEQRPEPAYQEQVVQKRAFRRDVPSRGQLLGTHGSNVKATERFTSEADGEVPRPEKLLKGTACHARGRSQESDTHQEPKRFRDSVQGSTPKLGLECRVGFA